MNIQIRPEQDMDYTSIDQINDIAFGQESEGILVNKLRKNRAFIKDLSLVACMGNEAIGHILFFPVSIVNKDQEITVLALAPMAVLPEFQGLGIGSQLVEKGLNRARSMGHKAVIVLGHKSFYTKFGFKPASNWSIQAPFKTDDEAFMALELKPGILETISGEVVYPQEFNGL